MADGRLRMATAADAATLTRHRTAMWRAMGVLREGEADPTEAAYADWVRRLLAENRLAAWVADGPDGPVASGCVYLQEVHPRPGHPGPWCPYLLSMFTEPEWRGRGLARAIVQEAVAWSRTHGATRLALHASAAGRPLYEAMGFAASPEMRLDL
ncbi:MAG TPA: GNAT family N-acetyltransferase [Candidatus Thermoplasmatota archaeon]|nr:GNAT family N-acetyltransferase [Candidatus Thermoplasmatota archaeon]